MKNPDYLQNLTIVPCLTSYRKIFYENSPTTFCVILLTEKLKNDCENKTSFAALIMYMCTT